MTKQTKPQALTFFGEPMRVDRDLGTVLPGFETHDGRVSIYRRYGGGWLTCGDWLDTEEAATPHQAARRMEKALLALAKDVIQRAGGWVEGLDE